MELQIGDVVYLNSDINVLNLMTINDHSVMGEDFWECIWFIEKELKIGNFNKKSLTKYGG